MSTKWTKIALVCSVVSSVVSFSFGILDLPEYKAKAEKLFAQEKPAQLVEKTPPVIPVKKPQPSPTTSTSLPQAMFRDVILTSHRTVVSSREYRKFRRRVPSSLRPFIPN